MVIKMTNELILECEQYVRAGGIKRGTGLRRARMPKLMEIDAGDADEYISRNRDLPFTELLFEFIDRTGQADADIYKNVRIDRRLFSKIRSDKAYAPAKKTVLALCLSLKLDRTDTDRLLSSAGHSLSRAEDYDLVIAFCIEKRIFDFFEINEILNHFEFDCF